MRERGAYTLSQGSLEQRNNVLALDTSDVETLGPTLQNTLVDVVLRGRVGESETKGQVVNDLVAVAVVSLDELVEAVGDVVPELIAVSGLELLGHAVLGLNDVELRLLVGQGDLTDTEVGATHVECEIGACLVAIGEGHDPCWVHGLIS